MNRGRVGLGILIAGAAVAARRRLQRKVEAGPDAVADFAASAPASEPAKDSVTTGNFAKDSAAKDSAAKDTAATGSGATASAASHSSASEMVTSPAVELAEGATLGSPEIAIPEIVSAPPVGQVVETVTATDATDATDAVAAELPPVVQVSNLDRVGSGIVVPQADGSASELLAPLVEPPVTLEAATLEPPVNFEPPVTFEPAAPLEPPVNFEPEPAATASAAPEERSSLESTPEVPAAKTPLWRRRFGGWSVLSLALLALLGAGAFAASIVRLPYYSLQPGSVYDTIERVEAPGDLVFLPEGEIQFVTVSQSANITPWQWLDAKLDENVRIRHEDEVRGEQTADEARANDLRRMQVSKNSAVVVALQKLGFELVVTPIGVEVSQVFECTAAEGTLGTGDLIVGVNGEPTPDGERLVAALIDAGIGQEVELLVERIDPANPTQSMRTDLVGLTLGSADDPCLDETVRADEPRAFIGIGTQTLYEEDLPLDIDVRTGRVGGPSAGLAFTLAIMDVLSEGELTNGLNIVATGSIDREGRVGPVGGIHQKTIAAERSGADVFLVPMCCDNFVDRDSGEPLDLPSNFEVAQEHADEMLVIGVDTIDDALRAIGELGGDVEAFLDS